MFLMSNLQMYMGPPCETLATTNRIVIAGGTRGPSDIGYEQAGFHWEKASIEVHLHAQSSDIAQGIDSAGNKDEGAGDQGIMFGYACRETPELMPAPIFYAHRILKVMSQARRSGESQVLGPDAKSQMTIRYQNGKPLEATQIVVSTQHFDENLSSHAGSGSGYHRPKENIDLRADTSGTSRRRPLRSTAMPARRDPALLIRNRPSVPTQ